MEQSRKRTGASSLRPHEDVIGKFSIGKKFMWKEAAPNGFRQR
jgi:hypothetical protein